MGNEKVAIVTLTQQAKIICEGATDNSDLDAAKSLEAKYNTLLANVKVNRL